MKNIYVVPLDLVQQAWNKCGHFIESAMEHAKGECTAGQLKVYLSQGSNQLLLFIEDEEIVGAVCFKWTTSPNHRIFYINAIGGKTSKEHTEMMFDYAKSNGGTCVRGSARESVVRLWRMKYGFEEIYRIVEKVL